MMHKNRERRFNAGLIFGRRCRTKKTRSGMSRWLHRPRYSRQEILVAGLTGFVLAWWLLAMASCIKKPPAPPPLIILDTGVDVC